MKPSDFVRQLCDYIRDNEMLEPGDGVVVGVSGGADSVALLRALHEIHASGLMPLRLHVAHVNHHLRGEDSDADARFVAGLCHKLGIACDICDEPLAPRTQSRGSLEELARLQRYACLEQVAVRHGCRAIAVAHHADDNAETILQRIARGTGIRGLRGILPVRPIRPGSEIRLIRPLLAFRRDEVRGYLRILDQPFREDVTNLSPDHTRNRIRHRVLPMLASELNPQVVDALLRLAEQARWVEHFLEETTTRTFETLLVSHNDQELILNAAAMARKRPIVQTELARHALITLGVGEQELSFQHLQAVADLLNASGSGKQIDLPGGVTVTKRYERLVFSRPSDQPREMVAPEVAVHLPGRTVLPVRRIELDLSVEPLDYDAFLAWRANKLPNEEWVDFDEVHPPLVVRPPRAGDRFWPLGAPGSKKIADFFMERRVPVDERAQAAILCDQLGPIWVVPHRIDERVKITRATRRVLKMHADRLAGE